MIENNPKKTEKTGLIAYYSIYTVLFIVICLVIAAAVHFLDRTVIWKTDGLVQHYQAYIFTKDWIQSVIQSLNVSFDQIPLYSFQLGQGADIMTTLNSYDLLDPVTWLSILIVPGDTYLSYCLMILLKVYLAGISFSLFAFLFTKDRISVFCGCMTYLFAGLLIILSSRHPNFVSGFYFLPLMLYGEELYLRKRRILPVVISVFLSVLTSYYVFYMSMILFAGYTLIHVLDFQNFKESFLSGLKIAGLSILGVTLAGIVILPSAYAFLQCSRSGILTGYTDSLLVYPLDFYKSLIQFAFVPGGFNIGAFTLSGIFPISVIAVILLMIRKTEWKKIRWMFLLLMAAICIPFCGRFMNVMGYPRNLWSYGMLLLLSISTAAAFPLLQNLKKTDAAVLILAAAAYTLYCVLETSIVPDGEWLGILILWITVIAVIIGGISRRRNLFSALIIGTTFLMVICNLAASYRTPYGLKYYLPPADLENWLNGERADLTQEADQEFFRVERQSLLQNVEHASGYHGTTFFWSIMHRNLNEYYSGLDMNALAQNCNIKGLDARIPLCELASVKYYLCKEGGEAQVPYGYQKKEELSNGLTVYENPYSLPIGYMYSAYIPAAEYEKLTPLGKQQALMQGAVLEKIPDEITKITPADHFREISYSIGSCQDAFFDGRTIDVVKDGGYITLEFEAAAGSELTVLLDGIKCLEGAAITRITMRTDTVEKLGRVFTSEYNWPVFLDGITFNLGSQFENKKYECMVEFSDAGRFSLDDIRIYAVSCEKYYEYAARLRENALEDIEINSNSVKGTIHCKEAGMLQFSIPDNGGWTVYVDGEQKELFTSGIIYMAVQVTPGKHNVELHYCTPFLKAGAALSGVTLLVLLVLIIKRYVPAKKRIER